jgi:DNA polymerase I-like protein with 3'-5' exonuclease and polymerase domains
VELAPQVAQLISHEMEQVAQLDIPLVADAKWGNSWYEAK